ncbi:IS200/IS605 family accessory protein TnpB-related protein [Sporolactobacillus sp. Y61]|uniref:IS200/IS605 family accessory protein TnpB-related protein n=1 Tax=Sporolactobacillus sp. Y61 TaxID=3160863 RepID=A0AAU8ICK7_9BACL
MVAEYNEKIINQRNDYLHKITVQLVKDNDVIVMEDLKAKNLLRNHKLSRAIVNQSWREMRRMLEYKCAWCGKTIVIVNPYKMTVATSSAPFCQKIGHLMPRISPPSAII